jgi:hypothetical protein
MAEDLFVDEGQDGNLWVCSREWGTAIAVCRKVDGQWFAAEDDSFSRPSTIWWIKLRDAAYSHRGAAHLFSLHSSGVRPTGAIRLNGQPDRRKRLQ